jgi:hypothetical protein
MKNARIAENVSDERLPNVGMQLELLVGIADEWRGFLQVAEST